MKVSFQAEVVLEQHPIWERIKVAIVVESCDLTPNEGVTCLRFCSESCSTRAKDCIKRADPRCAAGHGSRGVGRHFVFLFANLSILSEKTAYIVIEFSLKYAVISENLRIP